MNTNSMKQQVIQIAAAMGIGSAANVQAAQEAREITLSPDYLHLNESAGRYIPRDTPNAPRGSHYRTSQRKRRLRLRRTNSH